MDACQFVGTLPDQQKRYREALIPNEWWSREDHLPLNRSLRLGRTVSVRISSDGIYTRAGVFGALGETAICANSTRLIELYD